MTIDKAIEILSAIKPHSVEPIYPDTADAIKLGIEALKRVKELREPPYYQYRELLPGESISDKG